MPPLPNRSPTRLRCIDVFRGITIFFMLVVNNPGSGRFVYWPLEHAEWNGLTPTDLVFPFFLFISGASIYFSLAKRKETHQQVFPLILSIVRRGGVIILLGVLIHSIPGAYELKHLTWQTYVSSMRFPGVLQRIGLVYILTSILYLVCRPRVLTGLTFSFLLLYYLLMVYLPVPGVGAATLAPGMNLAAWLDRCLIGSRHLYQVTYFWDPEGLLSTLPAVSTGLLGLATGRMLKEYTTHPQKLAYLVRYGLLYVGIGLVLIPIFPCNKNLWSPSFVCVTAGIANVFLAGLYYLVEVRMSVWWTKTLIVYGMNSILVYMLAESIPTLMGYFPVPGKNGRPTDLLRWSFESVVDPLFSSHYTASLVWALAYAGLYLPLLWVLYRRNIFLKV